MYVKDQVGNTLNFVGASEIQTQWSYDLHPDWRHEADNSYGREVGWAKSSLGSHHGVIFALDWSSGCARELYDDIWSTQIYFYVQYFENSLKAIVLK